MEKKLQQIYSILYERLMASSLSNLVNNLSEGLHRTKCELGHDDEKCETWRNK